MKPLNYHHLYYFYRVATEGHLGRMAEMLNLSQSALSIQICNLEERLGQPLFDHAGRKLTLTEAGRIALDHATRIFGAGDELLATLRHTGAGPQRLRVGGLSTLSRNFQLQFLHPALALGTYPVVLKSGTMPGLLADLKALALDVVLTTELPPGGTDSPFAAQRIDDQTIGLHGRPTQLAHDTLQDLLANAPLILPTDNVIQTGFENLIQKLDVQPNIVAHVDDMAMVRLLARDGAGVAVSPSVVLADAIGAGLLTTAPYDLGLKEPFYAVTLPRRFPHPGLAALLS